MLNLKFQTKKPVPVEPKTTFSETFAKHSIPIGVGLAALGGAACLFAKAGKLSAEAEEISVRTAHTTYSHLKEEAGSPVSLKIYWLEGADDWEGPFSYRQVEEMARRTEKPLLMAVSTGTSFRYSNTEKEGLWKPSPEPTETQEKKVSPESLSRLKSTMTSRL